MQLSAGSVFYDIDADPKRFYLSCLHQYVCRMPTYEYVLVRRAVSLLDLALVLSVRGNAFCSLPKISELAGSGVSALSYDAQMRKRLATVVLIYTAQLLCMARHYTMYPYTMHPCTMHPNMFHVTACLLHAEEAI
jgi:hypothetical protein